MLNINEICFGDNPAKVSKQKTLSGFYHMIIAIGGNELWKQFEDFKAKKYDKERDDKVSALNEELKKYLSDRGRINLILDQIEQEKSRCEYFKQDNEYKEKHKLAYLDEFFKEHNIKYYGPSKKIQSESFDDLESYFNKHSEDLNKYDMWVRIQDGHNIGEKDNKKFSSIDRNVRWIKLNDIDRNLFNIKHEKLDEKIRFEKDKKGSQKVIYYRKYENFANIVVYAVKVEKK